jgi:hypothetical protein
VVTGGRRGKDDRKQTTLAPLGRPVARLKDDNTIATWKVGGREVKETLAKDYR